jgi:hypothetical protein
MKLLWLQGNFTIRLRAPRSNLMGNLMGSDLWIQSDGVRSLDSRIHGVKSFNFLNQHPGQF